MTRRTPAAVLLAATAALALAACAHSAGTGSATTHRSPATAGLGANGDDTTATPTASDNTAGQTGGGTGGGNGNGTGGGHGSPSPSRSTATGPQIVSFTATGAVCPVKPQPDAPYGRPGQVTISWKIANADGVSLAIDGGQYTSYDGTQGSDTISFQCPLPGKTNTHKYTLTIKNTGVKKTVSASAPAEPA